MSYIGALSGGEWEQFSTEAGQVYYARVGSSSTQYNIPHGWEDNAQVRILCHTCELPLIVLRYLALRRSSSTLVTHFPHLPAS